jgi:hypothetical protein
MGEEDMRNNGYVAIYKKSAYDSDGKLVTEHKNVLVTEDTTIREIVEAFGESSVFSVYSVDRDLTQ